MLKKSDIPDNSRRLEWGEDLKVGDKIYNPTYRKKWITVDEKYLDENTKDFVGQYDIVFRPGKN